MTIEIDRLYGSTSGPRGWTRCPPQDRLLRRPGRPEGQQPRPFRQRRAAVTARKSGPSAAASVWLSSSSSSTRRRVSTTSHPGWAVPNACATRQWASRYMRSLGGASGRRSKAQLRQSPCSFTAAIVSARAPHVTPSAGPGAAGPPARRPASRPEAQAEPALPGGKGRRPHEHGHGKLQTSTAS